MRMSRSPQKGGFHRCTGGGPFFPALLTTPAMASRPVFVPGSVMIGTMPIFGHCPKRTVPESGSAAPSRFARRSRERDVHIGNRTEPNMAYSPTGYENHGALMPQSWRDVCIIRVQE